MVINKVSIDCSNFQAIIDPRGSEILQSIAALLRQEMQDSETIQRILNDEAEHILKGRKEVESQIEDVLREMLAQLIEQERPRQIHAWCHLPRELRDRILQATHGQDFIWIVLHFSALRAEIEVIEKHSFQLFSGICPMCGHLVGQSWHHGYCSEEHYANGIRKIYDTRNHDILLRALPVEDWNTMDYRRQLIANAQSFDVPLDVAEALFQKAYAHVLEVYATNAQIPVPQMRLMLKRGQTMTQVLRSSHCNRTSIEIAQMILNEPAS